ncbi:MAG: hypothetical protein K0S07_279 [Chlamydiales bacterium]|jgi:hypothetical protein|nr:hypothetical protein [Chlamydiales bacterium]
MRTTDIAKTVGAFAGAQIYACYHLAKATMHTIWGLAQKVAATAILIFSQTQADPSDPHLSKSEKGKLARRKTALSIYKKGEGHLQIAKKSGKTFLKYVFPLLGNYKLYKKTMKPRYTTLNIE